MECNCRPEKNWAHIHTCIFFVCLLGRFLFFFLFISQNLMATSKPGNRGLQRTGWLRSTSQLADVSLLFFFFFTRVYVCSLKTTGQPTVCTDEHQNPCEHLASHLRRHLLDCFCFQSKPGNDERRQIVSCICLQGLNTHPLWPAVVQIAAGTDSGGFGFVSAKFYLKDFLSPGKAHTPQVKWTAFTKTFNFPNSEHDWI